MSVMEREFTIPPGTVVVAVGSDQARWHGFTISMQRLAIPRGSQVTWSKALSISGGLNNAIQQMPDDHDWLWLMGDDHLFADDLLFQLLKRSYEHDLDMVVPLCFKHSAPLEWVIYQRGDDGDLVPFPTDALPADSLVKIDAAGSAGMLIRRRVLDRMGHPWFKNTNEFLPNEDINFCQRAQLLGFELWVDVTQPLGHIGSKVVTPAFHPELGWGAHVDLGNGHLIWTDQVNEHAKGRREA